jgi:predicted amidohydrolase
VYTVVILYEIDTQYIQFKSLATRINQLTAALVAASAYLDHAIPAGEMSLRAIFLGPEYLFSRAITAMAPAPGTRGGLRKINFGPERPGEHVWGERRQMREEETLALRQTLATLSTRFQDVLLIPGSVAWRKQIAGQYARQKYQRRLLNTSDINMALAQDDRFGTHSTVFPTSFEGDPRRAVLTIQDKIDLLGDGTAVYVAKNTAHCYFNGACIFKYNKIGDFHEVQHGIDTVHIPSGRAGRFTIPAIPWLDFGIAICYDQSLSAQIDGPQGEPFKYALQRTETAVDIHMLLSAHINPFVQNAHLKQGGYLLSCSSAAACNQVLHSNGNSMKAVHTIQQDGIKMEFFLIKPPSGPGMFTLRVMGSSPDDSLRFDYGLRSRSNPSHSISGKLGSLGVKEISNFAINDVEVCFPGLMSAWTPVKPDTNYWLPGGRYSFELRA